MFVPKTLLHISEDEPSVTDIAVQKGVVKRDELRRACRLEPLGPEQGGDELIPADAQVEMDAKKAAGYFTSTKPGTTDLVKPKGRGLNE